MHNIPPKGKVSPSAERALGVVCVILCVASWTWCNYTTDTQWQFFSLLTGLCYFLTAIGLATDNGVGGGGGAEE